MSQTHLNSTQVIFLPHAATRLFPFQQAALINPYKNPALWAHDKHSDEEWKKLGAEDRAAAVQESPT